MIPWEIRGRFSAWDSVRIGLVGPYRQIPPSDSRLRKEVAAKIKGLLGNQRRHESKQAHEQE